MINNIREVNDSFSIEEILGEQKALELKCKLYGIKYEIINDDK